MKPHQRKPQSFHKTTKQERMQRYYAHIQAKYSDRTSLEPLPQPKHRATSSLSFGNVKENNMDFMHTTSLATPRAPTQRIGNLSYPNKAWQSPESSLDRTSAAMMYNNVSEDHNCHPTFLPEASVAPKYHGKFSGNSVPKWNQLYRAYHASSN